MHSEATHGQEARVPTHVAIIMDGNGRWAKLRGLPRTAGHGRGADAVRRSVKAAAELGIGYLTLYGFSSENWKRSPTEIDDLMGLLRRYLLSEVGELHKNGVRVRVIGERDALPRDIVATIANAEELTRANTGLNLTVALSYGSRQEMTLALRSIARAAVSGQIAPEDIDQNLIGRHLLTAELPDPDLLIRTGGEKRLSNFLLWQSAYTELVFLDILWPEFGRAELEGAINEFIHRERRFGATGS
ncbi:MAG: isoprenyl transferase [Alphaproteobacteria bacterium]|nr:isoprenyl transferase [Alphaproteobacteria bacterium]